LITLIEVIHEQAVVQVRCRPPEGLDCGNSSEYRPQLVPA
jgi:hypothetical protein